MALDETAPARQGDTKGSAVPILMQVLERYGVPLLTVLMIVFFSLDSSIGSIFRGGPNVRNLLGNEAVTGLVALAMVVPLVAGYFDLSVSAVAGVSNVAIAATMGTHHWPIAVALLFGLALGALIGFINGFLVARMRLNGFVVTLGSYTLLLGLVQFYTGGEEILNGIPQGFASWGSENWFGIPKPFYLLMLVALLTWYVLQQIPYGRYLKAIGSNESAARLVGINTERVIWISFVVSGVLAASAGALQTSRSGAGDPAVATSFLFPALTAVFLGATMIQPGRYNVWGTIIGIFFLAIAVSGFTLLGANTWVESAFDGAALILAVMLSTLMSRRRERLTSVTGPAPPREAGSLEPRPNAERGDGAIVT